MKYTALSVILALQFFLIGCNQEIQDAEAYDLSLSNVKSMLSKELTVNQLYEKLGPPVFAHENNYGNIMYQTDEGEYVIFSFKGPYVVGAKYGDMFIEGDSHNILRLWTKYKQLKNGEYEFEYAINDRTFKNYDDLKEYISKLPRENVVEYPNPCSRFSPDQPFTSQEQVEDFKIFCEQHDVALLWHRSG